MFNLEYLFNILYINMLRLARARAYFIAAICMG